MIDGPYREFLSVMRAITFQSAKSHHAPEVARQMLTYYEGLQSVDDRTAQFRLKMPQAECRWVTDHKVWPGNVEVDISETLTKE